MIKFFRKIRQKLLSENKFSKYLIYAIGEIVLVVIGILIALSINNWNEVQKDKRKAVIILEAIRSDMGQDLDEMRNLKVSWANRLVYFQKIYPSFNPDIEINVTDIDTSSQIKYWTLFGLSKPFRSHRSSFDAMISEGNSNLITNKKLFADIQEFYSFNIPANEDYFEILRQRQMELSNKYAHVLTYKPYKYLREITDEYLIADLNIYFGALDFYYRVSFIRNAKVLEEIIAEIDKELKG
jgi:hypothetical protein